jgi:hypothetical protein
MQKRRTGVEKHHPAKQSPLIDIDQICIPRLYEREGRR